jgi:enterochelin esterase family protein
LGGLQAAFVGLKHPEVFGNVLSQSGAFAWKPDGEKE